MKIQRLIVVELFMMLLLTNACGNTKEVYLPEQYHEGAVSQAAITLSESEVIKAEIIITMDSKSTKLEYKNGKLKATEVPYVSSSKFTGRMLVEMIDSVHNDFVRIAGTKEVYLGIVGDTLGFDVLYSGESILVYETRNNKLSEVSYDGIPGIAWASFYDENNYQVHRLYIK